MKAAVITTAGISSRFNEGMDDKAKVLKGIYTDDGPSSTLLYHLIRKCRRAGKIVIVGGYKYEALSSYISNYIPLEYKEKLKLIFNEHFEDFASGYSLYLGIQEALKTEDVSEMVFVEGDLDVDDASFDKVWNCNNTVLTYNNEPIQASKAVVLYEDSASHYKYAFNTAHGLLKIEDSFTRIFNSGQLWKFRDLEKLKKANDDFSKTNMRGTNLYIIQKYLNSISTENISIIELKRWTNCNTRSDYDQIKLAWKEGAHVIDRI